MHARAWAFEHRSFKPKHTPTHPNPQKQIYISLFSTEQKNINTQIPPSTLGYYVGLLGAVDEAKLLALLPAVGSVNVDAVLKLVPAVNALDPAVVGKLAAVLGRLTPETFDSMVNLINLGIPGINAVTDKLNLLPFAIRGAEPKPFVEGAAAPAAAPAGAQGSHKKLSSFLG